MFKLLISPAKKLELKKPYGNFSFSKCVFIDHAKIIHKQLKQLNALQLSKLMAISEALGKLNYDRNQAWSPPFTTDNARAAIFTFNGDVYNGLDPYSLGDKKIKSLQDRLFIISGLYGLLKPLDLIQAYRLEMGTAFSVNDSKDLYGYWNILLTSYLAKELRQDQTIVNLASKEYAKAIDFKSLNNKVITPEFKDFKNGKLKTISFFAKKARGMMVRYVVDNEINEPQDLLNFNSEGYRYDKELSSENKPIFTR